MYIIITITTFSKLFTPIGPYNAFQEMIYHLNFQACKENSGIVSTIRRVYPKNLPVQAVNPSSSTILKLSPLSILILAKTAPHHYNWTDIPVCYSTVEDAQPTCLCARCLVLV
ncbi:hypothetical protein FKM82_010053 [Ascaphus truei]